NVHFSEQGFQRYGIAFVNLPGIQNPARLRKFISGDDNPDFWFWINFDFGNAQCSQKTYVLRSQKGNYFQYRTSFFCLGSSCAYIASFFDFFCERKQAIVNSTDFLLDNRIRSYGNWRSGKYPGSFSLF